MTIEIKSKFCSIHYKSSLANEVDFQVDQTASSTPQMPGSVITSELFLYSCLYIIISLARRVWFLPISDFVRLCCLNKTKKAEEYWNGCTSYRVPEIRWNLNRQNEIERRLETKKNSLVKCIFEIFFNNSISQFISRLVEDKIASGTDKDKLESLSS